MPWKSASASKRASQECSGRQQATQRQDDAQRKPWREQRGTVKHRQQRPPSQTTAKAKRKWPTAPTKCGGHSTTGLFNNCYL